MTTNKGKHPDLVDCEPTIKFINMFWEVIAAMSSRCPIGALSPGNDAYNVSDWTFLLKNQRHMNKCT